MNEQHHEFMNGVSPAGEKRADAPGRGRWFAGRLSAADLRDDGRLMALYGQAVAAGRLPDSDWCRQEFVAAAEHALRVAANPPGLFLRQVQELSRERGQRRLFTSEGDDEAAAKRIRRMRGEGGGPAAAAPGPGPALSEDGHKAGIICRLAAARGVEPWRFGQPHLAGWDRARWERAVGELRSEKVRSET